MLWHSLTASLSAATPKFNFIHCQPNNSDGPTEQMQSLNFYSSRAPIAALDPVMLFVFSSSCSDGAGREVRPPRFCVCKHFYQHLELNGYWTLLAEPKECWTMVEIDECLGAFSVTPPHLAGTKSCRCDSQHPSTSQL